jgi:hypothetical protein
MAALPAPDRAVVQRYVTAGFFLWGVFFFGTFSLVFSDYHVSFSNMAYTI